MLSLSGGGFRGLFTARVLERLEAEADAPLRDRFDLTAGTSIGGILAIGLAAGVPARDLRSEIQDRGPQIFKPRKRSLAGFLSSQYDPAPLAEAVEAILGPRATRPFADLAAAVLVVAIDQQTATPRIFRSSSVSPDLGSAARVLDVAMATSAAPTYFPPHKIDGIPHIDGGLIANAPDLIVATEAMRRFATPLDALSVCAIGTAGGPRPVRPIKSPGKLSWIARHDLVSTTIEAQAELAAAQIDDLLPGAVLRIDARPRERLRLDNASTEATQTLLALADAAVDEVLTNQAVKLRALLAARTRPLS